MKYNKIFNVLFAVVFFVSTATTCYAGIATDAKLEYNKGIDYYQLGQYEEAASCFKQAVELDPNYIDAYYNLGSILEYLKQDDAALAVFKQIILRKPDDYEAAYKAAQISKRLGELEKAKMYLSLIPKDSMLGSSAVQLAKELDTDLQTIKAEQEAKKQPQTFQEANPESNSHGSYNDISSPTGIVTDNSGNLYVAGFSDNTIYKIGPQNKKIVYIKSEKIDGPIGIAIDNNRNIYIANYNKDNVLKVDSNGEITEIVTNVQKPYCLHITGDLLFISSQGSNSVIRYKLNK
jgi:tetratricopeptide (TPR) repeat protein